MYCSNCGKKLVADAKFCTQCGEAISADSITPDVKPQGRDTSEKYLNDNSTQAKKAERSYLSIFLNLVIGISLAVGIGAYVLRISGYSVSTLKASFGSLSSAIISKSNKDAQSDQSKVATLSTQVAPINENEHAKVNAASLVESSENYLKVHSGSEYVSGWKRYVDYLYIQSKVDGLVIERIILNRGNCGVMTNPAYQGSIPLDFGATVKVIIDYCQLLEFEIRTNKGSWIFNPE